jgi:hypothetical protein
VHAALPLELLLVLLLELVVPLLELLELELLVVPLLELVLLLLELALPVLELELELVVVFPLLLLLDVDDSLPPVPLLPELQAPTTAAAREPTIAPLISQIFFMNASR